ncbi:MAG TPA: 50S ribosomal protein L6 [Candidatus Magasanikbacteria bacterium]|nr:50S ribosomal protein L6 [Candidatus Magasanikbacteria bacterium]
MSRVGKTIRKIPSGVTVEIKNGKLEVKGPKGNLSLNLHPRVTVSQQDGALVTGVVSETSKKDRALWGTFSSLIENLLEGVTNGFKKELEINGVGYKVSMKGADLQLEVGYSHPIIYKAPKGITFKVEKNVITVEGFDKQLVGETAAQIRKIKKPEPYKGKGIKYMDEVIRRKAGKTAAKSSK